MENSLSNKEFKEKNNIYNTKITNYQEELEKLKSSKENSHQNLNSLINDINIKINSQSTIAKITETILDYMVVSKINDDQNNLLLDIFLLINEKDLINQKTKYTFKRGYDTKNTKKYQITYQINYHF